MSLMKQIDLKRDKFEKLEILLKLRLNFYLKMYFEMKVRKPMTLKPRPIDHFETAKKPNL